MQTFHTTVGLGLGSRAAWEQLAIALNQAKVEARELGQEEELGDSLETIPRAAQVPGQLSLQELQEVEQYLGEATSCSLHPLHRLLHTLVECYNVSYGGVRSHPTLLPHALQELSSITSRLYQAVRCLFPGLPSPDAPHRLQGEGVEDGRVVTPPSLLHPLLLPALHPTVFTMFALREARQDAVYWERILRWNKHPDSTLLIFLDVDPQFYLEELSTFRPRESQRDRHFLPAIHTLQQLKTTFTPTQKLVVIGDMFRAITESSKSVTWSMDTLLPVCMYVVVRARLLQLGAELAMLQELMEDFLFQVFALHISHCPSFYRTDLSQVCHCNPPLQGEQGIMLTTLLAAYHQMLRESIFIN